MTSHEKQQQVTAAPQPGAPWAEVARWRKAERSRLLEARRSGSVEAAHVMDHVLASHIEAFLRSRGPLSELVLSAYWPFRGEPDLRPLLAALHGEGATIALPDVTEKNGPLTFRRWTPDTRMIRGFWNILVPPRDAEPVTPEVIIAPLVGWSAPGYRLGYGGGYFDRTLASLRERGHRYTAIGIGRHAARLDTIHPQPHDIALDVLITEQGIVGGATPGTA